jgi:O-antigen/teichoic acid export membrane protein
MIAVGIPAAIVFGRSVLTVVYRPEYSKNLNVFVVMVATAGVGAIASFLGYGMTAARLFRIQMPVIGFCTAVTAGLSLVWVPRFGLLGAANALLLSSVVNVLAFAFVLWHTVTQLEPL